MNQILWENLVNLISEYIGFHVKSKDYSSLESKIQQRINTLKLSGIGDYYNLLRDSIDPKVDHVSPQKRYQGVQEWNKLANIITNGESFFFRDRGQFSLLQETILPQLINHKRQTSDFNLKLWSSGCSTGQEPYSLAILLHQIIPDIGNWNIKIIGTDINKDFLNKAERGIYQDWSFRLSKPLFKRNYFTSTQEGWKINKTLQDIVTFCQDNIVQDQIIPVICQEADLILCRNVFIYFEKPSVIKGINKFYAALKPGGYLVTGHSELQGVALDGFKVLSFPESIIYQKTDTKTVENSGALAKSELSDQSYKTHVTLENLDFDATNPLSLATLNSDQANPHKIDDLLQNNALQESITDHVNNSNFLSDLESLLTTGQYSQVIEQGQQIIEQQPDQKEVCYIVAQAYANQGNLEPAERYCQQALAIDSIYVDVLYLLAQIAESKNNLKKAKELLKRIIYLEPSSVIAYLELGAIYMRESDLTRASKMYQTAYELLQNSPSEATFDYQGITTTSQLITHLEHKLSNII